MDKTKMLIISFVIFAVIGSMAVIGGSMLAKNTVNKSNQQIEEVANDLN